MVGVTPDFWHGRRVLVTGHTGFKGSWLCLWLESLGAKVTGFALPPGDGPNLYDLASVGAGINSMFGDIRDLDHLARAVLEAEPEIVFHLAAQSLVRHSYNHPVETYHVNVLGTVHLLEAVRRNGRVKAVINITSDKCYENREWVWGYRESDPMGGHDPYSSSKGCAELVTSAYRNSFFAGGNDGDPATAIASARSGNVIGGGDWATDRLVPDILRAFSTGKKAKIRSPDAIRPWQHVLEPICGYLVLAERLCADGRGFSEGWNFGPDDTDACSVARIADRLAELWGGAAAWASDDGVSPHEAQTLKLDCSKARHRLGWRPRWSLEKALEHIVAWQKACLRNEDIREHSLQDIAIYNTTTVQAAITHA